MKALVRNKGETITENDITIGIDWKDGMPLTSPYWAGGAYSLIDNYTERPEENEITETKHNADRKAEIAALKTHLDALENDL